MPDSSDSILDSSNIAFSYMAVLLGSTQIQLDVPIVNDVIKLGCQLPVTMDTFDPEVVAVCESVVPGQSMLGSGDPRSS